MTDYEELGWKMERLIHKYLQFEKQPHKYNNGLVLTHPEVHTIVLVGDNLNINVTQLAKLRGVTKGAASQMVYKLVDKGLIKKRTSPDSDTEVCLTLTSRGKEVYKEHGDFHIKSSEELFKSLNDMPDEMTDYVNKLFQELDDWLNKKLSE